MLSYLGKLTCENCGIEFKKRMYYEESRNSKHNYCSVKCANEKKSENCKWSDEHKKTYGEAHRGENNPNYGKRWSDEQREAASIRKTKEFADNPQYAYECGKTNRGKKMTPEEIHRMHGHRAPDSYNKNKVYSEETKLLIGEQSAERWKDEEYAANIRKLSRITNEASGFWLPKESKSDYENYYNDANWNRNMIEFFDDVDIKNLQTYGMFVPKSNNTGWCRDHILTRRIGFLNNIPPILLRHPANMNFISHSENSKKARDDMKLSYGEHQLLLKTLIVKIIRFDKPWHEHVNCIEIIKEKYENVGFE